MTTEKGPYKWQRLRHRLGEYPRPAQPSTYQPNQKPVSLGWGGSTRDYWGGVFDKYRNRR